MDILKCVETQRLMAEPVPGKTTINVLITNVMYIKYQLCRHKNQDQMSSVSSASCIYIHRQDVFYWEIKLKPGSASTGRESVMYKSIKDMILCSICLEVLKKLKLLRCGRSFCLHWIYDIPYKIYFFMQTTDIYFINFLKKSCKKYLDTYPIKISICELSSLLLQT